ncbi:putative pectate lyase 2 [Acorus calamus]|uniref:Pectate lyase n=1 Tax=Acorus calamus TaxID=4465 RepID=A0AAV9FI62_ACOCL|nr:putative pectate lyase 2 [Acorus calamus]
MATQTFQHPLLSYLLICIAFAPLALSSPTTLNVIDACWFANPNWARNRRSLADCAVGFGKSALGGKFGNIYIVNDTSDDPIDPKPGTLRYAVIQTRPLWIVFSKDMFITLENELIVNSFKTIDGRGVEVEIGSGPCITVQGVRHVVIHGIGVRDCARAESGLVRSTSSHVGMRRGSDGVGWGRDKDHGIVRLNAQVMLFGHKDGFVADKKMKVTVVFNRFGQGLVQRMPRCPRPWDHVRFGGCPDKQPSSSETV